MNITAARKIWFSISGALVIASIGVSIFFGLNLGLDYTGGIRWHVAFEDTHTPAEIMAVLNEQGLTKNPQIQIAENNEFLITLQDLSDEQFNVVKESVNQNIGATTEVSFRKIDASIGASFQKKAILALIFAMAGIILFVAWAFRKIPESISPWRFGAVAIIALLHDVIIVLGVFTILGFVLDVELDLTFITALLATLGFSVNDTIVILDRVRENIRKQKTNETFEDTVEKSIQETLVRSLGTSFSTLIPLLSLLFLGADSIFYFILALTIGIAVGTYSSIFLAAPMLVTLKDWADKRS